MSVHLLLPSHPSPAPNLTLLHSKSASEAANAVQGGYDREYDPGAQDSRASLDNAMQALSRSSLGTSSNRCACYCSSAASMCWNLAAASAGGPSVTLLQPCRAAACTASCVRGSRSAGPSELCSSSSSQLPPPRCTSCRRAEHSVLQVVARCVAGVTGQWASSSSQTDLQTQECGPFCLWVRDGSSQHMSVSGLDRERRGRV